MDQGPGRSAAGIPLLLIRHFRLTSKRLTTGQSFSEMLTKEQESRDDLAQERDCKYPAILHIRGRVPKETRYRNTGRAGLVAVQSHLWPSSHRTLWHLAW